MNLESFLEFLRSGYDYGTGVVPFKADFVDRLETLLRKVQPQDLHLKQLASMINALKNSIKDRFAYVREMTETGELDFAKACTYDYLNAYSTVLRPYFEIQLNIKPVIDQAAHRINFYDNAGAGDIVMYFHLPQNFFSVEYIAKMEFKYVESTDVIRSYLYVRPLDDSGGKTDIRYILAGETMPHVSEVFNSIFTDSRELALKVISNNRSGLADFINSYPRAKRALNKVRVALGLSPIALYNVAPVFVNGFIEAMELVVSRPELTETLHSLMELPSSANFITNGHNGTALNYINRYASMLISCDWGAEYPYLCRVRNGIPENVSEPTFLFDGSAITPLGQ